MGGVIPDTDRPEGGPVDGVGDACRPRDVDDVVDVVDVVVGDGGTLRSGFVTVVGRPNVGKSTLVNKVLGTKVTITSARPNTTRRSVRGVLHRPGVQAVFVDTPGLHRPRTALGHRLNEHVGDALADIDVVVAVLDATAAIGPGDRLVLERSAASSRAAVRGGTPVDLSRLLIAVNKIDQASPAQVLGHLAEAERILEGRAGAAADADADDGAGSSRVDRGVQYFPVSAATGAGVEALVGAVLALLPVGPPYYPEDMVSDVPEAFWVGELVREQLLVAARQELPHSIACRVTEWEWPRIRVEILVERESQKGIVIGHGGTLLKEAGTAVRAQLPPGAFLELFVRVEKRWQHRPDAIERLGY